jgi:hypothetical protein
LREKRRDGLLQGNITMVRCERRREHYKMQMKAMKKWQLTHEEQELQETLLSRAKL